jgi:hypothetical protein
MATNNTSTLNTPPTPAISFPRREPTNATFDHTKHRSGASDHRAKIIFERLMKK